MMADEWIGVDEVAAEMRYTPKQAWEFLRSIGVLTCNPRHLKLARFTRAEFNEARERAKSPIAPRHKTGLLAGATAAPARSKPTPDSAITAAAIRAKIRGLPPPLAEEVIAKYKRR
jgi:hypothetical protein